MNWSYSLPWFCIHDNTALLTVLLVHVMQGLRSGRSLHGWKHGIGSRQQVYHLSVVKDKKQGGCLLYSRVSSTSCPLYFQRTPPLYLGLLLIVECVNACPGGGRSATTQYPRNCAWWRAAACTTYARASIDLGRDHPL